MMSAGGKVVRSQKEKSGKMNSSSQNGKPETTQTSKVQPTAEQVRLAQILSDRSEGDPEIAAKVNQIIDLTGRSSDEVMTVLYDCDYDINRTVEKLLESQEALVDEWQVIDKKKKLAVPNKGSPSELPSDVKFENTTETTEFVINHMDGFQRGRGMGRGGLRFPQGRSRTSWSDRTERSRDNTSHERETRYESNRGHRRGNYGEPRGRGGRRGGRSLHSNKFETQIDTWTSESMPNGEDNSRFGSWTDVADEWTADEWNGSLNESCVFTPSVSSHSAKIYSDPNNVSDGKLASAAHQGTTMTFESSNRVDQSGLPGDMMAAVSGALFTSAPEQDSIGQHYITKGPSLPSSVSEVGNCYGDISDRTTYVSHYNREATECIKNVMGIGRSNLGQNSSLRDEMVRGAGHQPQVGLQQSSSTHNQGVKQARPRLPPPSKIPSMPVEMPDSMNSGRLDVQFGSWDSMPAATDANSGFISDVIPPEYKGSAKISSSQAPSNSGTNVATRPMLSAYDPNASKAQVALSESRVTSASKPNTFSSAALSASNKGNESLHHMVVSISSSSNDLLTSATKPSGSASAQLGFIQLAYSSASCEGGPASGNKLLLSNGPSHYGTSFGYHTGPSSLVTMSSDYTLTPEHVQYTYGDSQRYGVGGPQTQQGFGSTTFPPGYSAGPQLHYSNSQGPAGKLFTPEKQGTGTYSVGSDVGGLYVDKQGTPFSASSLSQSYDSASVYQSAGGFQGGGGQPSSISLSYPGIASGLSFQVMQMDSSGFDAGQYPGYRQKEGPAGYEAAVATDAQRSAATSGIAFSGVQVQTSQSFIANFGSGSGQSQVTQSTSVSSFIGQSTPPASATQGQGVSSAGSFANQRLSSSAGPGFANHTGPSQSFGGQVEGSQSTAAVAPSGLTSSLVSSSTTGGKLSDSVSKLNLKDGGQPGDPAAMTTSVDGAGMSASGVATPGGGSTVVASSVTGMMTLASKMSLSTPAKTSLSQSKPLANMASGMASGTAAMLNHNYMIGQPPGFQLATFGYPATQQPLAYSSFEELQMLQQRFTSPMPYYEMALQTSAALPSRESTGPLGAQSYTGNDMKLAAMDVLSPVNAQPNQQPQTVTGNQQAFINHALHPAAAYSYYYPGPTGILPYYPMVPMAAIPSVSNPTFAGTTSTTQYQKSTVFGSHAYAMGGQAQDFTKTFGTSQVPNKPSAGMATGMNAASGDLITGAAGFGKTHIQTFERGGFHGGTPPPAFSMALPGGTQAAGALGAPTVYGPPYVPIVPHQQSHSQLLHHAVPQDSAVAGRPVPPAGMQQKMSGSKTYNTTAYWGPN